MTYQYENVLLVNPGALASGSLFTRQKHQTVALLSIHDDGTLSVAHVDLAVSDQVYVPNIDWKAQFEVALGEFQSPIMEQDLCKDIDELGKHTYSDWEALKNAILPLCHPCWTGEKEYMTRAELLNEIECNTSIAPTDREKVVAILSERASLSRSDS